MSGGEVDDSHESLFQRGFGESSVEKGLNCRDDSRKYALEGSFGESYNRQKIAR